MQTELGQNKSIFKKNTFIFKNSINNFFTCRPNIYQTRCYLSNNDYGIGMFFNSTIFTQWWI